MIDNIINVDFELFAKAQQLNLMEQDEQTECQILEFNRKERSVPDYPEHEQLARLEANRLPVTQLVGEFLDWLVETHDVELPKPIEILIAGFFEIDLKKLEAERELILAAYEGDGDDSTEG